jgi:hypothetical protein
MAFADSQASNQPSFQNYFANMRLCLNSDNIATCLPPNLNEIIAKPAEGYTRQDFVEMVVNDPEFRAQVLSCFSIEAHIILDFGDSKLFRSGQYACSAEITDNRWRLSQFYLFFSHE